MIKQKSQPKADRPLDEKIKSEASSDKTADKKLTSKPKTAEPTTMDELFAATGYELKPMQRGHIADAKVIIATPKQVLLDLGGKSEAVVHEKELPYVVDLIGNLKPGDTITVQVVNTENDRGQTVVSLRKTALFKRWETLIEKMKQGEEVDVTVRELTRGGFLVDYLGLRGFIPLSQTESEFSKLGDRASGRRVKVKILEVDREANRLVFSQTSGGIGEKQKEALKLVEIGKTYTATVTGIAPFGAFVSVVVGDTSLPGLVHISEIAWEKVENINDYVKAGKTMEVKAIGADPKLGKLTLSLKQLLSDPWDDVTKVFSVEQQVRGKVTRMSSFGAFVSLLPGIEGLIHISKMAPGEEPKQGDEIECTIEEINPEKRKISLSLVAHAKPIGYR